MIPLRSEPGDDQSFSPEVGAELEAALREEWPAGVEPGGRLERAVQRAAHEARSRGLRPEQLLLAFKKIEAAALETVIISDPGGARLRLLRILLDAYYR